MCNKSLLLCNLTLLSSMIYVSLIVHNQKEKKNLNMIIFIPISYKNYNFLNLFLNPVFLHPSLVPSFYHQLIFPRSGNDHQKTDITL